MADITFSFPPATVGEDYSLSLNILDPNTGAAIDLSTYTGDFQIRQASGTAIILEASTANQQMTLIATAPQVTLNFPASALTAAGTYQGELKLIDTTGVVSKPIGGPFTVQQTITP